ncbi:host cell attachment protein [Novosphingobium sp. ERN07]|uniref:host attachment protein n=1 Tax=Novosphingobium sp. ERN07 TaxID=2726187 RepID=UPI00145656D3|nr:host attachment protein [Novosphingobium sp. ERN07]NLR70061.1 host cell attachment protein [Novosphingobium sp. ERN07]
MLIPHGAIIAVIDGNTWQLLRNAGTEAAPELTEMETPALVEHNHSAGGSHASPHNQDEAAHCAAVADWINRQVLGYRIADLIVIAPPRALGELRHQLGKAVQHVLRHELAKDMIGRKPTEIIAALRSK